MQAVLAKGYSFRFKAKGSSMSPFIRDGDVITIESLKKPPQIGDIVAYQQPDSGMLVVHRIVARQGSKTMILGDGIHNQPEDNVPIEKLLGRVSLIERNKKQINLGLGPERMIIAWLSKKKLLIPITKWLIICYNRMLCRKRSKCQLL